jgi:hypothetical protein
MIKRLTGFGFAVAVAVLVAAPSLSGQDDTFQWTQRMTSGQVLEIKGISGRISAVPASGEVAEVVARKTGRSGDLEEVAVEVAQAGDRIVICAVYGSWNHGQDRCHPDRPDRAERASREERNRSINVSVEYEVRVPRSVRFEGTMISGRIEAEGLGADVSATTVSGPIRLSTNGRATASSVSGTLDVQLGSRATDDLRFRTVSGDIILRLPESFDADLDFSSISGHFDSDFDMNVRSMGGWVGSKVRGTIGRGGAELSLNTVSGDVRLIRVQG